MTIRDEHEILQWCRNEGISEKVAAWLMEHEEELQDASPAEIDALIWKLEEMI